MALISIITVCFNAASHIETSIKSVLGQTFKDFEYLIVDGQSTDGTVEILKCYEKKISTLIVEKDNGIYDAMNKALKIAKGDYILFIGADDALYRPTTLGSLALVLEEKYPDLLIGKVKYSSGKVFLSQINFKTVLHNTIHHQGALYHKSCFENFKYDDTFKLIADYELNLKLFQRRKELKIVATDEFVSICTDGGASRLQLENAKGETNRIRRKVLGNRAVLYRWLYELKFFVSTKLLP